MNSNQIAEKFSNGLAGDRWLTRKQSGWLMDVSMRESAAGTHFGRRWGKGEFRNENGLFRWEASEGYNGSALLKVAKVEEAAASSLPTLQEFVAAQGYDFQKINNTPLMGQLAIEYSKSYAS